MDRRGRAVHPTFSCVMNRLHLLLAAVMSARVERFISYWAALMIFAMMIVTIVDVTGRYGFSSPLLGGFEITETLLALTIFAGLPLASKVDAHITVDLLTVWLSARGRRIQLLGSDLTVGILCLVMSAAMAHKTVDLWKQNETTPQLNLPVAPIAGFMSLACLLTAMIYALRIAGSFSEQSRTTAATESGDSAC